MFLLIQQWLNITSMIIIIIIISKAYVYLRWWLPSGIFDNLSFRRRHYISDVKRKLIEAANACMHLCPIDYFLYAPIFFLPSLYFQSDGGGQRIAAWEMQQEKSGRESQNSAAVCRYTKATPRIFEFPSCPGPDVRMIAETSGSSARLNQQYQSEELDAIVRAEPCERHSKKSPLFISLYMSRTSTNLIVSLLKNRQILTPPSSLGFYQIIYIVMYIVSLCI